MYKIGELLFRTTGLLTKRGVMRKSTEIGEAISGTIAKNGKIAQNDITEIIGNTLGRKSSKINITFDKESFVTGIQENLRLPQDMGEMLYNNVKAASIPRAYGEKVIVNLPLEKIDNTIEFANIVPHEFEHALFQAFTPLRKIDPIVMRLTDRFKKYQKIPFVRKYFEWAESMEQKANPLSAKLQGGLICEVGHNFNSFTQISEHTKSIEGLLSQCKCKTIEELHEKIRELLYKREILNVGDFKSNYIFSRAFKHVLKDESRAYTVGGSSQKMLLKSLGKTSENATYSELNSMLFDEAIKILKQESKSNLKNRLRQIFGFKTNTQRESAIIEKAQREFEESVRLAERTSEKVMSLPENVEITLNA